MRHGRSPCSLHLVGPRLAVWCVAVLLLLLPVSIVQGRAPGPYDPCSQLVEPTDIRPDLQLLLLEMVSRLRGVDVPQGTGEFTVVFPGAAASKLKDPTFDYENFYWAGQSIFTLRRDQKNPNRFYALGSLYFFDVGGRRANVLFEVTYTVTRDRIMVHDAILAPRYPSLPSVGFFMVSAHKVTDDLLQRQRSHADLLEDVRERAIAPSGVTAFRPGQKVDLYLFAFSRERLPGDSTFEFRIDRFLAGTGGVPVETRNLHFNGWIVAVARAEITFRDKPFFLKTIYLPGTRTPEEHRIPRRVCALSSHFGTVTNATPQRRGDLAEAYPMNRTRVFDPDAIDFKDSFVLDQTKPDKLETSSFGEDEILPMVSNFRDKNVVATRIYLKFDPRKTGIHTGQIQKVYLELYNRPDRRFAIERSGAPLINLFTADWDWNAGKGKLPVIREQRLTPTREDLCWDNQPGFDAGRPWAAAALTNDPTQTWIRWDITDLVINWMRGDLYNNGFVLLGSGEGSLPFIHAFCSSEYAPAEYRPRVVFVLKDVPDQTDPYADKLGLPRAPDPLFLESLFHSILHREPDPKALETMKARLQSGSGRDGLLLDLFAEETYRDRGTPDRDFIRDAYQGVLGREPSSSEVDKMASRLKNMASRLIVVLILLESDEYGGLTVDNGGSEPDSTAFDKAHVIACGTDEAFVRSVYHSVFGREPGDSEVKVHVNRLRNGTLRWQVVWNFLLSTEYKSLGRNGGEFMTDVYQAIYAREPTASERKVWPRTRRSVIIDEMFKSREHLVLTDGCADLWREAPANHTDIHKDKHIIRLGPIADSYVYAYAYRNWNKSNRGAHNGLQAGWHPIGGESRTYLKFDLSGADPNSVEKAILMLFHYHTGGGNSLSVGVHAVTGTWQEGGGTHHSGQTEKPAAPGEISWVNQPTFDLSPVASFKPGSGTGKYIEVDITPLVKAWLFAKPNYGLMIKPVGIMSGRAPESSYGFYSREHQDKSKRHGTSQPLTGPDHKRRLPLQTE